MDRDWEGPTLEESLRPLLAVFDVTPEVVASVVGIALPLEVLRLTVFRRPRTCFAGLAAFLTWLLIQVYRDGYEVLYSLHGRGTIAMEATGRLSRGLVDAAQAWSEVLLPFALDVCWLVVLVLNNLTLQQKLGLFLAALAVNVLFVAYRMLRKHAHVLLHTSFHLLFLLVGPAIWYSAGMMSGDWLEWCLGQVVTWVPTFMSLWLLHRTPPKFHGREHALPAPCAAKHYLWLSYWVCWPLLAFVESSLSNYSGNAQLDLQRGMLVFIIWLQFWDGSRALHFVLRKCLRCIHWPDRLSRVLGRGLLLVKRIFSFATGAGLRRGAGLFSLLHFLTKRLWLIGIAAGIVGLGVIFMIRLFFGALTGISQAITVLLWCFAAADTADTLAHKAQDFYSRKLAFWVLAILYEALGKVPYAGTLFRLFEPVAFSLWLVAGETVLRSFVLPALRIPSQAASNVATKVWSCCIVPAAAMGTEEDEVEEEDEVAPATSDAGSLVHSADSGAKADDGEEDPDSKATADTGPLVEDGSSQEDDEYSPLPGVVNAVVEASGGTGGAEDAASTCLAGSSSTGCEAPIAVGRARRRKARTTSSSETVSGASEAR
mmetsp:Transcript_2093/g.4767  ORF Transcript_2093/g.4767 Transcript_2093/m.4767 type:complete len:599 (-) Transcript_2093:59-1855(-)